MYYFLQIIGFVLAVACGACGRIAWQYGQHSDGSGGGGMLTYGFFALVALGLAVACEVLARFAR